MLRLRFPGGEHEPVELTRQRITIGRDASNDVVLDVPGVSGFHAEIQNEHGKSFLVDLGSTNGTQVNGNRVVGRRELAAWDALLFEKVVAEVEDTEKRRPTVMSQAIGAEAAQAQIGWALVGQSKDVLGKRFPLTGTHVLGREAPSELIIPSDMVSRRHAELRVSGGQLAVRDLGSVNGTFVNKEKVTDSILKAGDQISFDQVLFRVEGPGADPRATVQRPAMDDKKTRERKAYKTEQFAPVVYALVDDDGKRYELRAPKMTVGRGQGNAIPLSDSTVSETHAELVRVDEGWRLDDLGSSNGTFVNTSKISSQVLTPNDHIRLGKHNLRYVSQGGKTGTLEMPLHDPGQRKTFLMQVRTGALPAWGYGLLSFAVVGLIALVGIGAWQILLGGGIERAPLQVSAAWSVGEFRDPFSDERMTVMATPVLADINGDGAPDVVFATLEGYVYALDGQAGRLMFHNVKLEGNVKAPLASADMTGDGLPDVIVADTSGTVYAIKGWDRQDVHSPGQTLWKSPAELNLGEIVNRPVFSSLQGKRIPDVIVPTANRGLVALDGERGWEIWNTAEMASEKVLSTPVVADVNRDGRDDFVYVTEAGKVFAVSSQGGRVLRLWDAPLPRPFQGNSPLYIKAGGQGLIVVATDGQGVFALNAENGRQVWSAGIMKRFIASPVGVDINGNRSQDVILVDEDGVVYALDGRTGDDYWTAPLNAKVVASPALFDVNRDKRPDLIVLDAVGSLHVLDITSGRSLLRPATRISGSNGFAASPLLADLNADGFVNILSASHNSLISSHFLNRRAPRKGSLWAPRKDSLVWPVFLGNDRHAWE